MHFLFESGAELITLEFDATIREGHTSSAIATEHVVESGVAVTDHVRQERDRLQVEVHVSNTPVTAPEGSGGTVRGLDLSPEVRPLGALARGATPSEAARWDGLKISGKALVLQFDQPLDRVRTVYESLLGLKETATPVTVVTTIRTYTDMVIVSLDAPRTATTGDALAITLDLVHLRKADTRTVEEPAPLETRAERNRRAGRQPAEEPSTQATTTPQLPESFASQLLSMASDDYAAVAR